MKKLFTLICVTILLFGMTVTAEVSNEIADIEELLASGTIDNYETILIPLRGDPENFNITPEDDLNTIEFGEGVEGYAVDFVELEKAYKKGEEKVSSYLVKDNKYYFPIIVSGREIAVVEVIKSQEGYRVFCVTAGPLSDSFIREKKEIDFDSAKYVTDTTIINGFVVTDGTEEVFVDLDRADTYDVVGRTCNIKTNEDNLVEEFLKRRSKNDETLKYGGGATMNDRENKGMIAIAIIFVVLSGILIYVFVRKKKTI